MQKDTIGFIGLGNIGKPIANNIARAGFEMVVYDIAGTAERVPQNAVSAGSSTEVAERSNVVFLSLPTLDAFDAVTGEIAAAKTPVYGEFLFTPHWVTQTVHGNAVASGNGADQRV